MTDNMELSQNNSLSRKRPLNHLLEQRPAHPDTFAEWDGSPNLDPNCHNFLDPQNKNFPKKKIKFNKNNQDLFTITCAYCSHKPKHSSIAKFSLINNFKTHIKKYHPSKTATDIQNFIEINLHEPESIQQFSINCPIAGCKKKLIALNKPILKVLILQHVRKTNMHANEKLYYSKTFLIKHLENNCKKYFISNPNFYFSHWQQPPTGDFDGDDEDSTDSDQEYFPFAKQSSTFFSEEESSDDEYSTDSDFSNETGSPLSSDDEYSADSDQECLPFAKQFPTFSDRAESPMPSDDEYSTDSDFSNETGSPLSSDDKDNTVSDTDSDKARFTIICTYCSRKSNHSSFVKNSLIDSFTHHMKKYHSTVSKDSIKNFIKSNLHEAEWIQKFSIGCPLPGCKYRPTSFRKPQLKYLLYRHILKTKIHKKEQHNHSEESLEEYVENNYIKNSIPNPNFSSSHLQQPPAENSVPASPNRLPKPSTTTFFYEEESSDDENSTG